MDIEHKQLVQLLPILPLLAELGRTQHITETAELLGVPQSTVSRAMARASAVVGTELLVRDGRGVRLTPAAKALLPVHRVRARRIPRPVWTWSGTNPRWSAAGSR